MGHAENSVPEIYGRDQMHGLVCATFAALKSGELPEVVQLLMARVFDRNPEDVIDSCDLGAASQWSFKPMVELLLRHVLGVMEIPELVPGERRSEIELALELAGF